MNKLKFCSRLSPIKLLLIGVFSFLLAGAFLPTLAPAASVAQAREAQAQVVNGGIQQGLQPLAQIGLPAQDPRIIVANLIRVFLGVLGTVAVLLVLYAGYLYLTSAGNAEKVEQAKRLLKNAVIGLAIIASAFGIVSFILARLQGQLAGRIGAPTELVPGGPTGTLGGGIIESHFPTRNATGIPRNTKIIVTFKEKMLLSSLINNNNTPENLIDDRINVANVRIRKSADNPNTGPFLTNVRAAVTEDQKSFVFAPLELLGSPTQATPYTVFLGSGIKKANGDAAFGAFGSYEWKFEVSTIVDNTPPQVESVIPFPDSVNPRNVIVQINFNEAIDPTTASGTVAQGKFTNISITNTTDNRLVDGTFSVSNIYRTVEFLTNDLCGVNSCGNDIFCLPGGKDLTGAIRAAALGQNPPEAAFPYNGIVDVAGNSLDGDKDGKAEGAPADNFAWSFKTTNEIDLVPPKIEATNPAKLTSRVELDRNVDITFSKLISFSSLNSDNATINSVNYWISAANVQNKSVGTINHDRFELNTQYTPAVGSGVKDIFQNCYNPCIGP